MEKKTKLIAGGVIVGILLIVLIWELLPSGQNVDSKAAQDARAAAAAAEAQEQARIASEPAPPPPPPTSRPKSGVPRNGP